MRFKLRPFLYGAELSSAAASSTEDSAVWGPFTLEFEATRDGASLFTHFAMVSRGLTAVYADAQLASHPSLWIDTLRQVLSSGDAFCQGTCAYVFRNF
jgi:hypothetical protein